MIRRRDITRTLEWIDASGVPDVIEPALRPQGLGRPRQLTVRALLVGLKLAVDSAKTACLTDVHLVLTEGLPEAVQHDLGVRDRRTGQVISVHQVRRLLDSIKKRYDPSPAGGGTAAERAARSEALQRLLDDLLAATMPAGLPTSGAYAVDGTGTWSWARGKDRDSEAADPDAAWGVKTSKSGREERYFGYELHAIVRVGRLNDTKAVPCLAERIVVTPASTNCAEAVLPAIMLMRDEGLRLREVIADRGYTYKTTWSRALRALDVDSVLDLHSTQLGARGSHAGARMIAGVPHCPATPSDFDTLARPDRLAASSQLQAFVSRIETREKWALRRVAGPDSDGSERYECPARAGKVRCPLVESSLNGPLAAPKVYNPPEPTAHKCCSQRTITVPGDVDYKSRQRHYWGSGKWIASFSRRSRVEGWFGNLKDRSREALARGGFRVMGLCKSSLMLGIYAAATNLRLLEVWAARMGLDHLPPLVSARPASSSSSTTSVRTLVRGPSEPEPPPTTV